MIELEDALRQILSAVPPPISQCIPLEQAAARVLTETLFSPLDLPSFDNSAMDGYAVRSVDVAGAKPVSPVPLRVIGRIAAGDPAKGQLLAGTCVRVFTGSALPRGADAVVMQEDTQSAPDKGDTVLILDSVKPWESVRLRGEDLKQGARLIEAGQFLTAGPLCLLSAAGFSQVSVGRQPVVGVLATGSELQQPGETLRPGKIYESNRVGLAAMIRSAGAQPADFPLVPDTASATRQALLDGFERCDVVITSGGVSVGDLDLVKSALVEVGGELQFWRVAIKPGRPFVFGRCAGKLLFGLPGNPVSALLTFCLLVRPALLRWQGATDVTPIQHAGTLAESIANRGDRRHFIRVKVTPDGRVYSAGVQGSHFLSSFATATGLLDMPPHTTLASGTIVKVIAWD